MAMKNNLYEETTSALKENGKTWEDVRYIVSREEGYFEDDGTYIEDGLPKIIPTDFFVMYAQNIHYDNGYGSAEVNMNLMIVGDDWWLERHEYDGAEWWEYKTKPRWVVYTASTKSEMMRLIMGEGYAADP